MLHRLKLRLLYGTAVDQDKDASKRKWRAILFSGFAVYPPFFAIAYLIHSESRGLALVMIGLLSAITCIPVVFYAYAKGFGAPFLTLFRERREELLWLGLRIGFLYPFFLYFMILGVVDFFMGYGIVRAAMISFVATAVARDGFEIGYYRARYHNTQVIHTFPDGQSIMPYLTSVPTASILMAIAVICGSAGVGFFLSDHIATPARQTLLAGVVIGSMATLVYAKTAHADFKALVRFFAWPAFTMAVTYFLGICYIFKMILKVPVTPSVEFAFLMAVSSAWLILETQFIGALKGSLDGGR